MPAPVVIAVVSYNTRDALAACLASMQGDAEAGRAEVWVVDNASQDGSAELVREQFPWVALSASDSNLGFGAAVNLVAARTRSDWLAASNADVQLTPGALAALLSAGELDPAAASLAPRLLLPDGSTQHSVHRFPSAGLALAQGLGAAALPRVGDRLLLPGSWDPSRPRRVPWAVGALLLVRRDAFEQAGGFDERQWMYAEDVDLAWRLAQAGWATRYVPEAAVRHGHGMATAQEFGEERDERWMRATYEWMRRRRGRARTAGYAAASIAIAALSGAALAVPARLWPRRYAARRSSQREWARRHRTASRPRLR